MYKKVYGDDREAEGIWNGDQGLDCRHCQGGQAGGGGLTWEEPRAPGIQRERPEIPDLLAHNYQVRILNNKLGNNKYIYQRAKFLMRINHKHFVKVLAGQIFH